ncbi:hypothetical protein BJX76DRAFT_343923 [Aspergillus varians]
MCTPHSLHACRWIGASWSTMRSLCPLAVILTAERGTTPTTENREPAGFQHLEHPQAWLCWMLDARVMVALWRGQWQDSVPPGKEGEPGEPWVSPLSRRGWREGEAIVG